MKAVTEQEAYQNQILNETSAYGMLDLAMQPLKFGTADLGSHVVFLMPQHPTALLSIPRSL
jgi:hypothetical protein